MFIRRLKLAEYFHGSPSPNKPSVVQDEDRCNTGWIHKNPSWYPQEVQQNRSKALEDFINKSVSDIKSSLQANDRKFWNNLSKEQRMALQSLATDDSIVINKSDKSGGVVVMDKSLYEKKCLEHLEDQTFYEELHQDPNPLYREQFDAVICELKDAKLLSTVEHNILLEGCRTPNFYGLPKLHNEYTDFPDLRPISSGTDSVS